VGNGSPVIARHIVTRQLRKMMSGKKILLIDDEESILRTYTLLLEEHGYRVVTP
jgi:CheY-like chemotaxis protein